jgi:hypothetical protein
MISYASGERKSGIVYSALRIFLYKSEVF